MSLILTDLTTRYENGFLSYSLTAKIGKTICLTGPSGAGKTTLLRLIAGFLRTESGSLVYQGMDLTYKKPQERPISILFQKDNLFPHLTISKNISLAFPRHKVTSSEESQALEKVLKTFELDGFQDRYPHTLSGGEQQRVALARSLLSNRPILLLDEPFTGLDKDRQEEVVRSLSLLQEKKDKIILITSHLTVPLENAQTEFIKVADILKGNTVNRKCFK